MPSAGYLTDSNGLPVGVTGAPLQVALPGTQAVSASPAAPATILNQASAAQTASGVTGSLSTTTVASLAVDVNVTVFTGGTAPSIQFYVDRLGVDGVWYRVWTGTALTTAGSSSSSVGLGGQTNAVLTSACRLGWIFAGTVNATSITFSASIVGR